MRGLIILIFVPTISLVNHWHINLTEAKPALSLLECSKTVEAEINTTIVLPCILKAEVSAKFSRIEWVVNETTDVHLYRNKKDDLSEQMRDYRGRTSLFNQELSKGNFSLNLRTMQSHAGIYQCTVKIGQTKYSCSSELIFRAKETTNPSQDPRKFHGNKTTASPPNSDVTDFTTRVVVPVAVVAAVAVAAAVAVVFYFQICKKKTESEDVELNDPQSQNNNGGVSNLMENSSSNLSNAQQQQPLLQRECPSYQESSESSVELSVSSAASTLCHTFISSTSAKIL